MNKAYILVGGTGCGKTYFSKQMISKVNKNALMVFDVNNEYKEFYPYPFNPDIDIFLDKAYRKQNCVILIEDATAFLSNRGRSDKLQKMLVAKRHSKNTYILLFHSMRAIPKYIMDLCTDIIIFKTNDPKDLVQSAFQNEELTKTWEQVQNACKGHKFFSTYPRPKGIAPPCAIFTIY